MQVISPVERLQAAHEAVELGDFGIVFGDTERGLSFVDGESFVSAGTRWAETIRAAHERIDDLAESIALLGGGRSDVRPYLYDAREEAALDQLEKGYYAGLLVGLGDLDLHG